MSSNINYLSINENFPVAGQDNDTQVFRDNFDTIKTNFRYAQEEINDLQDNTAKLNEENDFANNLIQRAVFQNNTERRVDAGAVTASPTTIDFENGPYQVFRVGADLTFDFLNFPTNINPLLTPGVGKVTVELYSDGVARTISFVTSGGTVLKKSAGFPTPFTVSSSDNPVFIEIWQHSGDKIFLRYLGQFS
jgi:hypothetical protein